MPPAIEEHATPISCADALMRFDARSFLDQLVHSATISQSDAQLALGVAEERNQSLLAAMLDLGLLSEQALADAIAKATGAPRWNFDPEAPIEDQGILDESIIPVEFMRHACVLVLGQRQQYPSDSIEEQAGSDGAATQAVQSHEPCRIVISDPSAASSWHTTALRLRTLNIQFEPMIGTHKAINAFFAAIDQQAADADETEWTTDEAHADLAGELAALRDQASEAPIIRQFNQIIERAMDLRASDIHLECFDGRVSLRYRVDGMLVDQPAPQRNQFDALLVRMKIMASLDIAERRKAQDGRIRQRLRGRAVDLRVSMIPTMFGQDAALRVQDRQQLADIELEDLGFERDQIQQLYNAASHANGILLITGPTGSGKTTTLYAMLRRLCGIERKIITVEDPIEYTMDGINQMQANAAVGMTFATALRHILRHDPDVILVGEIRDHETAEMAFQSALTGHMVLSTLHTNDVPSTFVRLVDMGVQPYLVNAAVEGISAQRLLRRLCSACKNEHDQRDSCKQCRGLGYRGRLAVMEFSRLPASVKQLLVENAEASRIKAALSASGFDSMRNHAERLVERGLTDAAEVIRVLGATRTERIQP